MYTWGYIKEAVIAKLDYTIDDAIAQGLVNKFYIYANEAITQITSSIKAKDGYADFKVGVKEDVLKLLMDKYEITDVSFLDKNVYNYNDFTVPQRLFYDEYNSYSFVGDIVIMPTDFVSYMEADNFKTVDGIMSISSEEDYIYMGSNKIMFLHIGDYKISYNARWYMFTSKLTDDVQLDVPNDILDCLPSYIVSQIFKIDDETKASVYRNEYEMFLSRIDASSYMRNKTIKIEGGW